MKGKGRERRREEERKGGTGREEKGKKGKRREGKEEKGKRERHTLTGDVAGSLLSLLWNRKTTQTFLKETK